MWLDVSWRVAAVGANHGQTARLYNLSKHRFYAVAVVGGGQKSVEPFSKISNIFNSSSWR